MGHYTDAAELEAVRRWLAVAERLGVPTCVAGGLDVKVVAASRNPATVLFIVL